VKTKNLLNQYLELANSYNEQRWIHYRLAAAYIGEGDYKNTLKALEDRGDLAKQKSVTWQVGLNLLNRSEILLDFGKIVEAEEKLAAGKSFIDSSDVSEGDKNLLLREFLANSTRLAIVKGDINQAKEYAEMYKIEAEKTENPNLIKWISILSGLIAYAEGDYEKAISDLKPSDPDNPFNNYYLALAYLKNGDNKNALDKFENVLNYSGNARIRYEMVRGRAKMQLSLLSVGE
jgi:tetratricopeptide (TPR) repeat protein